MRGMASSAAPTMQAALTKPAASAIARLVQIEIGFMPRLDGIRAIMLRLLEGLFTRLFASLVFRPFNDKHFDFFAARYDIEAELIVKGPFQCFLVIGKLPVLHDRLDGKIKEIG